MNTLVFPFFLAITNNIPLGSSWLISKHGHMPKIARSSLSNYNQEKNPIQNLLANNKKKLGYARRTKTKMQTGDHVYYWLGDKGKTLAHQGIVISSENRTAIVHWYGGEHNEDISWWEGKVYITSVDGYRVNETNKVKSVAYDASHEEVRESYAGTKKRAKADHSLVVVSLIDTKLGVSARENCDTAATWAKTGTWDSWPDQAKTLFLPIKIAHFMWMYASGTIKNIIPDDREFQDLFIPDLFLSLVDEHQLRLNDQLKGMILNSPNNTIALCKYLVAEMQSEEIVQEERLEFLSRTLKQERNPNLFRFAESQEQAY
ncbi:MAG: hypothetical protein AB8G05_22145 [Oligoflexales bacterium]